MINKLLDIFFILISKYLILTDTSIGLVQLIRDFNNQYFILLNGEFIQKYVQLRIFS